MINVHSNSVEAFHRDSHRRAANSMKKTNIMILGMITEIRNETP
jgi:hypothetical protein